MINRAGQAGDRDDDERISRDARGSDRAAPDPSRPAVRAGEKRQGFGHYVHNTPAMAPCRSGTAVRVPLVVSPNPCHWARSPRQSCGVALTKRPPVGILINRQSGSLAKPASAKSRSSIWIPANDGGPIERNRSEERRVGKE